VKKKPAKKKPPNYKPGSPDAAKAGCKCPVLDNHHGSGFPMGGRMVYWISEDCKLHAPGMVGK